MGVFEDGFRFYDKGGFVFCEVVFFAGVFCKVVDFDGFLVAIADGFPVTPTGGLDGVSGVEFPVEVVALWGLSTFEVGEEGVAIGFVSCWWGGSAHFYEGGYEVPEGPGGFIDPTGGDGAGPPSEGGLSQGSFVHATLVSTEAVGVLFEEFADFGRGVEGGSVVAGEDDEGIFMDTEVTERVDEFANVGVHTSDLGGVGFLEE